MLFETSAPLELAELISLIGESEAIPLCDNGASIRAVAPISESGKSILSFSNFSLTKTLSNFNIPDGAILIVKKSKREQNDTQSHRLLPYSIVEVEKPRHYFFQAVRALFRDEERSRQGIHKLSFIATDVVLGDNIYIGPFVSVEKGCKVHNNAILHHGVMLAGRSVIGENTIIRANSVIGVPGQAIERNQEGKQLTLPHLGRVVIGMDTIIGSQSIIVAGSLKDTKIGVGVMIGNQVNIGHNCEVGDHCFIAPQVVIAGSVSMGPRCWVAPGAKILNKLRIGKNSMIGLGSVVTKPVKENSYVFGNPAVEIRKINKYNK